MVVMGHLGDGNIHLVITVGSMEADDIHAVEKIVYQALEQRQGVISAEHGIGLEKRDYLGHSRSAAEIALMKTLKLALDPERHSQSRQNHRLKREHTTMNGAERLLETLVEGGVEVCFSNPGTSEMQLVSAIGNHENMRAILCLFEGVVSGAADGYARMKDKPALTLLHVGSGFSNSMANLHNAKRAHVPLVNMVGDHATYHLKFDAPLTSDVPAHAKISSDWFRVSESADDLAVAGAQAVQAALQGSGKIATLIAPANHAWEDSTQSAAALPHPAVQSAPEMNIEQVVTALGKKRKSALLLGGRALREASLATAGRIAKACGVRLLCETFTARLQRGAGRTPVERLPYFAEQVSEQLAGLEQLILVGATAPVSFFAYPGKESWLTPEGCEIIELATVDQDCLAALQAVAGKLGAHEEADKTPAAHNLTAPDGVLSPLAIGQSLTMLLPDNAIISDEAATCGLGIFPTTENAPPHDWLMITGGAIGQGLPLSLGAAVACPDRKSSRAAGGWQRNVHRPGSVVDGAGKHRCHGRHHEQPQLRHPQYRTGPGGRGPAHGKNAFNARSLPAGYRLGEHRTRYGCAGDESQQRGRISPAVCTRHGD